MHCLQNLSKVLINLVWQFLFELVSPKRSSFIEVVFDFTRIYVKMGLQNHCLIVSIEEGEEGRRDQEKDEVRQEDLEKDMELRMQRLRPQGGEEDHQGKQGGSKA